MTSFEEFRATFHELLKELDAAASCDRKSHFRGIGAWFRTIHQHTFLGRHAEAFYNSRCDHAEMRP